MQDDRPSKKQRELLSFIDGFVKGYGYGPSYREIMRALNYKSVSTVATHIDNLIAKGYLLKRDNSARSLEVVEKNDLVLHQPSAMHDVDLHKTWLVERVTMRIEAYHKKPDEIKKTTIDTLIVAVHVLVGAEVAEQLTAKLQNQTTDDE